MTPRPTTPCRLWTGYTGPDGYGRINRKAWTGPKLIHRWTYEQEHGPIPQGMVVMHLCDVRNCYALDHLAMGTQGENLRMAYERGMAPRGAIHDPAKGGRATCGEVNGKARLTEDNVRYVRASPKSNRQLAAEFGVTKAAISHIRTRRTWKHVR